MNRKEGQNLNLRPEREFAKTVEVFAEGKSARVLEALEVAIEIHKNDKRKTTGEPYINHCVAVASILESWDVDEDEVVAGLLHDTWEDHPEKINLKVIKSLFGERVAFLVDGVTKLKSKTGEKSEFETLRKVTRESLIDPGVARIKLSDRIHNMVTMDGMKPETQKRKAKETLAVYAPLAESFGMWEVKNLLQDLSFPYFDPQKYEQVKQMVDADVRLSAEFIGGMEELIVTEMKKFGINVEVGHSLGGYYEIYEKQKKRGMRGGGGIDGIAEIPDVISFRVILPNNDLEKCYAAMGVMRMKLPDSLMVSRHVDELQEKAVNGYSALKDVYVFEEGAVEICFITKEREHFNKWGFENGVGRKLIFTPKEELLFLEPNARAIDVAYRLNPNLGMKAVAVKIDGKLYGLDAVVPNTAVVEVITDTGKNAPDKEWLGFANLETRRVIEKQLMVTERDRKVALGKEILQNEVLVERGILEIRDLDDAVVSQLLASLSCWYGTNDLYYKVADGMDTRRVKLILDNLGIRVGVYTSVLIEGDNAPGVAKDVAQVLAKHKADTRNVVERVTDNDRFLIRILMKVDYKGKKKIEEELKRKYSECVVV